MSDSASHYSTDFRHPSMSLSVISEGTDASATEFAGLESLIRECQKVAAIPETVVPGVAIRLIAASPGATLNIEKQLTRSKPS